MVVAVGVYRIKDGFRCVEKGVEMKFITRFKDKLDTKRWAKTVDSYNAFMSNHGRFDNCYNPKTHDCDGSCQGATDCLFAKYFRDEIKKPTPFEMRCREINGVKFTEELDRFTASIDWTEFNEKMKEVLNR